MDDDDFEPLEDCALLEEMVRALVANPSEVRVENRHDGERKTLLVRVADEDCGKVIGKQGRMADVIRQFMSAVGTRQGYQLNVMIEGSKPQERRSKRRGRTSDRSVHVTSRNGNGGYGERRT